MANDIQSKVLANGQTSDITDYNTLRSDMLTVHDHSAGKGAAVSHASLADGVLGSTLLDHAALNKHVQGGGLDPAPDSPGGAQGVHGLPALVYVLGCLPSQMVMQSGTATTGGTIQAFQNDTTTFYDQYVDVEFPSPFANDPAIFLLPNDASTARVGCTLAAAQGDMTHKFRALVGFPSGTKATQRYDTQFSWVAIGVLA
jgi:hypothetical protein